MVLARTVGVYFRVRSQIQFLLPATLRATSPPTRKLLKKLWEELYGLVQGARKLTRDTLHHKKTTTYKPQVMLLSLHYLVRKICKVGKASPVSTVEFGRR